MKRETIVDTLLDYFLQEADAPYCHPPADYEGKRAMLHAVLDVRTPAPVPEHILSLQDKLLTKEREEKGVVRVRHLPRITDQYPHTTIPHADKMCLWQGDITRLDARAIVNAANSKMLGCFLPRHACIDNAIHAAAGVRLRLACDAMMRADFPEGSWDEPVGQARITKGFNLPAKYVLHTVGPKITHQVTQKDRDLLAACYRSCLETAVHHKCTSVAFCCISTGVFRFPNEAAAAIALHTVTEFLDSHPARMETVIFNVFSNEDYKIYHKLF